MARTLTPVPLHVIWSTPAFQAWYQAMNNAGNRLENAEVIWSLQFDDAPPVLWALDVNIYVAFENRVVNEVVIGRQDVSTVVLWTRGASLREAEVALVREFRCAVRTADGNVRALPGGASKENVTPLETAVAELGEETGFTLPPERLVALPQRQASASISCFCANAFSAEITPAEMAQVKTAQGSRHGVAAEGEMTYIEVVTLGDLLDKPLTDWATLGMVFAAITSAVR